MTDRERLVELINGKTHTMKFQNSDHWFDFQQKCEELADYLLSNGVIVLPCKIGDVVYVIDNKLPCYACTFCTDFCHTGCPFPDRLKKVVKKAIVKEILISQHTAIRILVEVPETDGIRSYNLHYLSTDFDKTIFFSEEEAERELKKRGE